MTDQWLQVPVGRESAQWLTARTQRTVLAVVHTLAGATHLLDAVELLESDPRIQVVFTQAPDLFSNGVARFIRDLDAVAIPWHQAINTDFDLALTTDCGGVPDLHAPVVALQHGVANNKLQAPAAVGEPRHLVVGLAAPWLTWYGRLVPSLVVLPHTDLRKVLAQQCPQALTVAAVTGDLCLDRLRASLADRQEYRRALGVDEGRTLVAVTSTWGPDALFGRWRGLLQELLAKLPVEQYKVVATMHPAVWHGHGPRQIKGWLAPQRRNGLRLVDTLSWRALAAAADVMLGDHGSAAIYSAAAGIPVLRTPRSIETPSTGTAGALLADIAPVLTADQPLTVQLRRAVEAFRARPAGIIQRRITSHPGRAAALLRAQLYRLLQLPEPLQPAHAAPVPAPRLVTD